jgi:hypothetical protein
MEEIVTFITEDGSVLKVEMMDEIRRLTTVTLWQKLHKNGGKSRAVGACTFGGYAVAHSA